MPAKKKTTRGPGAPRGGSRNLNVRLVLPKASKEELEGHLLDRGASLMEAGAPGSTKSREVGMAFKARLEQEAHDAVAKLRAKLAKGRNDAFDEWERFQKSKG